MLYFKSTSIKLTLNVLICLSAVMSVESQEDGNVRTCKDLLDPYGCNLGTCMNQCYEKHRAYGGVCVQDPKRGSYSCYCVYPC